MKTVKIVLVVLVILIAGLLAAPFVFKGKIISLIKEEANAQLNAKLDFDENIDLSLIRSFPNLTLSLHHISISNTGEFLGDTLFSANTFSATLDIMSVIKGQQIQVRKIALDQPRIQAFIRPDGKANWDIAKTDTTAAATPADTGASKFNIKLKSLEIEDGYLVYDDQQGKMYSKMEHLNYSLEGDFNEVLFTLKNKATVQSLTYGMDGINYLSGVNATANMDMDADMNNMKFVFKQNEVTLNDLAFAFNGTFAMHGDDMVMDITYAAKQNEFKSFLSLIPALYTKDFKDLQSKGKMAFDGFVKGTFNDKQMPAFGLNLSVDGGWFKYPALPAPVENVNMKLNVNNPDGNLDHTLVNLSKLHLELAGDPFDARLKASTPISDPFVDFAVKGKVVLDNIAKIAPIPEGTKIAGIILADFQAKGNVSSLGKKQYESFDASGTIEAKGVHYESPEIPKPFDLKDALVTLSPKAIQLNRFDAKIGKSDMQMSGQIANFIPYYFDKGTLSGSLNFNSSVFDANEFLNSDSAATPAAEDTAAMTVFEVPKNIDFNLNSHIGTLTYTNMEITNFIGNIQVANQKLTFSKIAMNTLGSSITMNGYYETTNPKKPEVDMAFGINNLDIQKAFKTFNTVKKIAPIAENIFGSFTTNLKMKTALTENMQPDYNTLFAEGLLSIPSAEVKNVKVVDQIADVLQKPEYKKVGFSNAKINYTVEKGRVYTKPFDMKLGPQNMTLSGSTGLDQTIDYIGKINIPRKDLGGVNSAMDEAMAALNKQAGSNIKLNDMIPVSITMGGTFTSPKVGTNLGDMAKSEAGSLKNQAMDELNKRKKELEDKAKAEIAKAKKDAEDKLRSESDRVKKEAEAKAKAESDRLKKEAEDRARVEADKLKNQAAEEAKKRLKGIFK